MTSNVRTDFVTKLLPSLPEILAPATPVLTISSGWTVSCKTNPLIRYQRWVAHVFVVWRLFVSFPMIWEYARRRMTIILTVYSSQKGHLWFFPFVDHTSLKHSVTHSSLSWIYWTLVQTSGARMPMSKSNNSYPCPALTLSMICRFNPTRWLDPTKKYKTSPQFLAFLGGPHRCIARAMAIMQLKIVVSCVGRLVAFQEPIS